MHPRVKSVVGAGVDRILGAAGYRGDDLPVAHDETMSWAKTRLHAARTRRGVVRGVAVVIDGPGRAALRPIEVVLAGPGEVTVEVDVSSVSAGTERAQWLRLPNAQLGFPYTPGYSGSGRVLASGDPRFAVGDRVAIPRMRHQSVATMPADWALAIPDGVGDAAAALVYLAIISGYGVQRARIGDDDAVCVIGAGPIGALAQRLVTTDCSGPITVIARSSRAEADSLTHGATRFLVADDDLTGVDATVTIEATGDPDALATAVTVTRPGGTVVSLGSPRGRTAFPLGEFMARGIELVGAHISSLATLAKRTDHDPFRSIGEHFLASVAGGNVVVDDLVGDPVDPREILRFYRRLGRHEVAGGHLDWSLVASEVRGSPRMFSLPALSGRSPSVARPPVAAHSTSPGLRPLRMAVIGCGDIGLSNARAVVAAPHTELVLCHDAIPALAQQAADLGAEVTTSVEAALDPDRVDAVVLSLPHDLHTPLIEQAAEAGLHVIVEKPLALDLAGANTAIEAARRAGVTLSVCFPFRYEAPIVAARALVSAGALGPLTGASLVFHADKPDAYRLGGFSGRASSDWRTRHDRSGGGVVIMNLTHYFDFLRHVTGVEVVSVSAVVRCEPGAEVEDSVALTLELEGGAVATALGSSSTRGGPDTRFEMWGEAGTLQLEPDPRIWTEVAVDGVMPGRWCPLPTEDPVKPRTTFMDRFGVAVRSGDDPDVTAHDGLAVQAIVEAAYRSAAAHRPVRISEVLQSP